MSKQHSRFIRDIILAIVFSLPNLFDIISDIDLAATYFREGHPVWASLTTFFVAFPWGLTFLVSCFFSFDEEIRKAAPRITRFFPFLALFGVPFIAMRLIQSQLPKKGQEAKLVLRKLGKILYYFLLIEAFLEA